MRYIEFGSDNRKASEIILGLMRISKMTTAEVKNLIDAALEVGINFLDTADIYAKGVCEEILGDVFKENPSLRDKVILQTKCGIRIDDDFTWFDFSKEHILNAVDGSLKRLKVDDIDCLLLHRPDALMEPDEIAEAFTKLHEAGKVKDFGVSNMNPIMVERLATALPFPIVTNQVQMSCAFTPMFNAGFNVNMENDAAIMRDGGVLEYCQSNGIVIQAWSALQYGYFEGVFLGSEKYPKLNAVLDRLAAEKGVTNTAIALAWILRYPGKMQAVIGTTKASRVKESAAATEIELSKKEWYEIYLSAGNILP